MAKQVSVTKGLPQSTLMWLAIFFFLVAVFVLLMYYRQSQVLRQYLQYQNAQQNAILKPVASPKPTVAPKPTPKPVKK